MRHTQSMLMLTLTGSVSHSSVEMTEEEVEVSLSECMLDVDPNISRRW